MSHRYLLLAALFASVGCPAKDMPNDQQDMAKPAADMRKIGTCEDNVGTKPVGEACTSATKCDCSGPKPTCLQAITFGDGDLDLPGGYCSNGGSCTAGTVDSCGDEGLCVDLIGDGSTNCVKRCTRGKCRSPEYACLNVAVDASKSNSPIKAVCLPADGLVECDPTKDIATQCTKIGGTDVSTLTNGNPNAACLRIGPDDVGQCRFLPCQLGPGNCPKLSGNTYGCFYFDIQKNTSTPNPNDKYKGTVCLPLPNPTKKVGDDCTGGFNTCGDNQYCSSGKCQQMCFNGTQPMFNGGNPMYKNAAPACPAGTKCTDVFAIGGANWPGLCQ